MDNKAIIVLSYKGNTYVFQKTDKTETSSIFQDRCWWIVKNMCKITTVDSKSTLYKMSYIWSAVKNLGVQYDESIMEKLSQYNNLY